MSKELVARKDHSLPVEPVLELREIVEIDCFVSVGIETEARAFERRTFKAIY